MNQVDPYGLCGMIPILDLINAIRGRCGTGERLFIIASYTPWGRVIRIAKGTVRGIRGARAAEDAGRAAGAGGRGGRVSGPGPRGGESSAAARGRQAHRDWDPGPGYEKEVTLPSGRRVDAINWETHEVIELKPNNPRAIREGEKQLQDYLDELNEAYPGDKPWTGRVETYDP
jgi:hypothetical protein